MLEPFKGEFFHHPAALEFSGNTCSNGCAYCFANTRSSERRVSIAKLGKLCLGKSKSDSLTDWLFNEGHAVCISNRSDPFATCNTDNTRTVLGLMDLVPNGVYIQTKGLSKGVGYDILDGFRKPNVAVYITIDTMRDDICARIAPGAPKPSERIELAKYCASRGWAVQIGINPCWPFWISEDEIIDLEDELLECGIRDYFIEPLSMKQSTYNELAEGRKARMPIDEARPAFSTSHLSDEVLFAFDQVEGMHNCGKGLRVYTQGFPRKTDFWADALGKIGKHLNPVSLFTSFAYDRVSSGGGSLFTFGDFLRVVTDGNDEMLDFRSNDIYKYIMCANRNVWKDSGAAKTCNSFTTLYKVCWNDRRMHHSPQNVNCFTVICDGKGRPIRDDEGNVQLAFLGESGLWGNRKPQMTPDELKGKGVKL